LARKTKAPLEQEVVLPSQIGTILRARRKARRLAQAALAEQLGISQARFSYLEAHPEALTVGRLLQLGRLLGIELVLRNKAGPPPEPEW
jgi:HTH-type transcriptional regulator/antitoxin HipB